MRIGRRCGMLLVLGVSSEAFVSGPAGIRASRLSHPLSAREMRQEIWRKCDKALPRLSTVALSTLDATKAQAASSAGGVDLADISGKRLWVQFAAFGFFERECQLELKENGDCVFGKGMVADGGAWRVEEEDGQEYLQFSCPLFELYSEVFDIPSSLLFWRVPLRQNADGEIILENGQIISERTKWFGLKTNFIDEGKFRARVLADDEAFPAPQTVDISDVEVPDGLKRRKRKAKKEKEAMGSAGFSARVLDQIPEPPLPNDLKDGEAK